MTMTIEDARAVARLARTLIAPELRPTVMMEGTAAILRRTFPDFDWEVANGIEIRPAVKS